MTILKRRRNKAGRITAWLVTWESMGDYAIREGKIAAIFAILGRRLTSETIKEIVEIIYANKFYTNSEWIAFAKDKKLNPCNATFDDIDGTPWQGRILCGHNPWLEARLVDNLLFIKDSDGVEKLSWDERLKPDISWWNKKRPAGENST